MRPSLAGALKDFVWTITGKMNLFGFDMEDMEELRTKLETSGRDLPLGMDKVRHGT